MQVSLTPKLEELVREKIESDRYDSATEVIRDALQLMHELEGVQELKLERLQRGGAGCRASPVPETASDREADHESPASHESPTALAGSMDREIRPAVPCRHRRSPWRLEGGIGRDRGIVAAGRRG
jgi:antitoxin ParD1/3/4